MSDVQEAKNCSDHNRCSAIMSGLEEKVEEVGGGVQGGPINVTKFGNSNCLPKNGEPIN